MVELYSFRVRSAIFHERTSTRRNSANIKTVYTGRIRNLVQTECSRYGEITDTADCLVFSVPHLELFNAFYALLFVLLFRINYSKYSDICIFINSIYSSPSQATFHLFHFFCSLNISFPFICFFYHQSLASFNKFLHSVAFI